MRGFLLLLAAAAIAFPTIVPAKAKPISKIEARQLSTAETKRRLLDQFADVLIEEPRQKTGHPVMPLSDVWYRTKVRSTDFAGLCSYDTVIFKFHPAGDQTRNAKTRVAVDGVEARTSYRFIWPASEATDDGREVGARDHAECAKLNPRRVSFFRAADEATALSAGHRFANLLSRIGLAKDPSLTVECPEFSDHECRTLMASMSLNRIERVDRCDAAVGDGECWQVDAYGPPGLEYSLDIYGPVGDARATKVTLRQLLVLADPRRD